jgi:hypothetical protein
MAFRRDFVPDLADFSVRADPIRHAHDSQERFPQKTLHPPRTVRLNHFEFRVRKQRKIQFVLDLEFCLVFHGVRAASQDAGVQLLELLDGVTKLGRFVDSTGCVCFGIEIEDEIPPAIIRKRDDFAVIGRYAKARSLVSLFQHAASSPVRSN